MHRTTRMRFTCTALAAATVMPLGVAAQAVESGPGVPAGTKTVTPDGRATTSDTLTLLTGSVEQLVYLSQSTVADAAFDEEDASIPPPNAELLARSSAGKTVDLGRAPRGAVAWSTAGDIVAASPGVDGGYGATNVVDTWVIGTSRHRRVTLPTDVTFLAAAPGGFLDAAGDTVELRSPHGTVVASGTPFPGRAPSSAASNSERYVVTDASGDVATAAFADPTSYQHLDSGTTADVVCFAVNSQGAACRANFDAEFIPLNGGAPNVVSSCPSTIALSGATLLWTDDCSDSTYLWSATPGEPTVRSDALVSFDLVSAYDAAVLTGVGPERHQVSTAAAANEISGLFHAPRSPETAGSFSLTASRIAYVSDLRDRRDPEQLTQLRSVPIDATPSRVRLSAPQTVAGRQGRFQVAPSRYPLLHPDYTTVSASGHTTAFRRCPDVGIACKVTIVSPGRTITLRSGFNPGDVLAASGHRVLVTHKFGRNPWVGIYDVHTGRLHKVLRDRTVGAVTLSGSHLAYTLSHGRVYRYSIHTEHSTLVFRPQNHHLRVSSVVAVAHGRWVAWHIDPFRPRSAPDLDGVRDMRARTAARRLPHQVYGLSDTGVLMRSRPDAGSATGGLVPITTWFATYDGPTHRLLSRRSYDELPQVTGHALAWVTVDGNLKVAPFRR